MSITKEDVEGICLSDEWLTENGIVINKDFYENVYNAARQCYLLGNEKNSKVAFDQSLQEVSIDLPQAGFQDAAKDGSVWDYGSNGFKIAYDVNTAKIATRKEPPIAVLMAR